jgi:methionine-rich copper-binding protein CopC
MKNLKKLLAVIVTVCVLATMTVPAFAAASDAEICEALDILRGDGAGVTDTYLAKGTERYQAAILYLRLIGKEDEAIAFTGEENFDDADLIYAGGQRILAYLKANPDLGWTGVGGNKFEPTNPASAQMIYKVLLEALGYKQDVDFTWAETLDFAAEKGLSAIADVAELTNADMAVAIVEALGATVKDSDATLAEKLVADGIIDEEAAAELGLVELAPATLEVVSVSADNLKEVVVVFNQPVDGDTVNKDNIKVDGKDGSVSLKDDKVTVVITIDGDGLENQTEYKLVVSGVKSADGTEIEKTEIKFKAFDATLPVAEKITVTGPNSFTITFSEPIEEGGSVDVKSGTSVIGVDSNFGVGGRDVTVKLYSSLVDGKTYEITVKEFKDYAGYQNVIKTFDLAYAKDNSAPTATIEKVDQKYVVVKFNKPVSGLHKSQFYHTFSAWTAIGIYKAEGMTTESAIGLTDSVDKVWVKFADDMKDNDERPIGEGETVFVIRGKTDDGEIKDNWGNKFETTEYRIAVTADKTAPEVTELSVAAEDALKIVFSEGVKFSKDNVEVYDADGKTIDGVSVDVTHEKDNKEWKITLGKKLAGKTIVVKIKDVEDQALQANRMATYTTTLTITDKTAPEVTKVTMRVSGDGKTAVLYVTFSEDVDSTTALDKANYALIRGGKLISRLSKDPAFFNGAKVVKLELTESEYEELKKSDTDLFVSRVKDLAGNAQLGMSVTSILEYNDPSNAPQVEKIEVLAADKAAITFDQYLKRVDRNAISVNRTTVAAIELSEKDGKTVVTVTVTNDSAKFKADISNSEVIIVCNDNYKILNIFDVAATNETITENTEKDLDGDGNKEKVMVDKVAPSITKTNDKYDIIANKGKNTIDVKFDEKIDEDALSRLTFEVKDRKVTKVALKSGTTNIVEITIDGDTIKETDKLKVTQKLVVVDMAGNEYKLDETVEAIVKDAD